MQLVDKKSRQERNIGKNRIHHEIKYRRDDIAENMRGLDDMTMRKMRR